MLLKSFILSACLILISCAQTQNEKPEQEAEDMAKHVTFGSTLGYQVNVAYENENAYRYTQKALFWRGRVDKDLEMDQLTISDKIDYLVGINLDMDMKQEVDIFISEDEATNAFQVEFNRARNALRPSYAQNPPNRPVLHTKVVD